MFVLRVSACQVPANWDIIKYALQETDKLGAPYLEGTFNHVFAKLLCDNMQCFIIYDKQYKVTGVIITELTESILTLNRTLSLRTVLAFEKTDIKTWKKAFGLVKRAAEADNCSRVVLSFSDPEILELCEQSGFTAISTVMEYKVGDQDG